MLEQARLRLTLAEAASAQAASALQAAVDTARTRLATEVAAAADSGAPARPQEAVTNAVDAQAAGAITDRRAIADATGVVMDAADDLAAEITSSRATRTRRARP